jgi:hypothetical protein
MSSHRLIEESINLMITYLTANMPTALSEVSVDWADNKVPLNPPTAYFNYEASGYRPPCIFVIGESTNFRLGEKGANFITAVSRINVSALIQTDKNPNLTTMAYRYQAALHKLLNNKILDSSDSKVRIVVKVERAEFSATFTNAGKGEQGMFRKEVVLQCDVEHYENLS